MDRISEPDDLRDFTMEFLTGHDYLTVVRFQDKQKNVLIQFHFIKLIRL
jgi:hypothetical protein